MKIIYFCIGYKIVLDSFIIICILVFLITTTAIKNILTQEQEHACYDFYHTYTEWCHSMQEQPNCKPIHITFVAMDTAVTNYKKVFGINIKTDFMDVLAHYQKQFNT